MDTFFTDFFETIIYLNQLTSNNKKHEVVGYFEVNLSLSGNYFTGHIKKLDTGEKIIEFSSDSYPQELKAYLAYAQTLISEFKAVLNA